MRSTSAAKRKGESDMACRVCGLGTSFDYPVCGICESKAKEERIAALEAENIRLREQVHDVPTETLKALIHMCEMGSPCEITLMQVDTILAQREKGGQR